MNSARQPAQPDANNPYPMAGRAGRFLGALPPPFTGENGLFTQAFANAGNTMRTHPIFQAIANSKIGQMLRSGRGGGNPPAA